VLRCLSHTATRLFQLFLIAILRSLLTAVSSIACRHLSESCRVHQRPVCGTLATRVSLFSPANHPVVHQWNKQSMMPKRTVRRGFLSGLITIGRSRLSRLQTKYCCCHNQWCRRVLYSPKALNTADVQSLVIMCKE
jgi:hypothetical protein